MMSRSKLVTSLILGYWTIKFLKAVRHYSQGKHSLRLTRIANPNRKLPEDGRLSHFFINKKGLLIFTRQWLPESGPVRASLFITHGYGEHSGRYEHVARFFTARGYAVFAIDHQGHGQSEGDRAFVEKFSDIVDDALQWVDRELTSSQGTQLALTSKPMMLLGHSMGGTIAIQLAQASPAAGIRWTGMVLSGPAITVDPKVASPVMVKLARLLSAVLPKLSLDSLDSSGVVRSTVMRQRYDSDPLVYRGGTRARFAAQFLGAMDEIQCSVSSFSLPFLVCHAEQDQLTQVDGSRLFYERAASTDKTIKLYPELYHEIMNEDSWREVLGFMDSWLEPRLLAAGATAHQ